MESYYREMKDYIAGLNLQWTHILWGMVLGFLCHYWKESGPLIQQMYIALGVLFWLDTFFGVMSSFIILGEKFASRKFRRCYTKMTVYFALMVLSYVLDSIFGQTSGVPFHPVFMEVAALFSLVIHESTSVLEHLKSLEPYTGFKIPEFVASKINTLHHFMPDEIKVARLKRKELERRDKQSYFDATEEVQLTTKQQADVSPDNRTTPDRLNKG